LLNIAEDASQKNALNPQTFVTVNGPVTTADFQYPWKTIEISSTQKLVLE
jgi:hypothetical protein